MDSERSPASSESGAGSWTNEFGANFNLAEFSSLLQGAELNGGSGGKGAASSAVYLVVNSARNGMVSLCTSVAKLIKSKERLEKIVAVQSGEIQRLKGGSSMASSGGSRRTSQSSSGGAYQTNAIVVGNGSPKKQGYPEEGNRDRPSSGCSRGSHSSPQPAAAKAKRCSRQGSNCSTSSRESADSSGSADTQHRLQQQVVRHINRVGSGDESLRLPEITGCPPGLGRLLRVPPAPTPAQGKVGGAQEVQCSLDMQDNLRLERQLREMTTAKLQLEEELRSACQEIERLKCQLKTEEEEEEEGQGAVTICDVKVENELAPEPESGHSLVENTSQNNGDCLWWSSKQKKSRLSTSCQEARALLGCKCTNCLQLVQHSQHAQAPLPLFIQRLGPSNRRVKGGGLKGGLHLDDHVVIRGGQTGLVKYVGHLDHAHPPNTIYIGVQLSNAAGEHDGCVDGKRYFCCPQNQGVFVAVHNIVCLDRNKVNQRAQSTGGNKTAPSKTDDDAESPQNILPLTKPEPGIPTCIKRLISKDVESMRPHSDDL